MLYLKKYFTEGLIQMAILLSLCGMKVDVGLEPFLSPSWHEMILGPTLVLSQTQFHNLRNHLEDGNGLHPKSVDLDGFSIAQRLLGWVHSLDRLEVPHAELETWLVQQEPDLLPVGFPDQTSPHVRAPAGVERDQFPSSMESIHTLGTLQEEEEEEDGEDGEGKIEEGMHYVLHHSGALDERREEEEEEEEEEEDPIRRNYRRAEGRERASYSPANNEELTQNEVDQNSLSLQECLRLVEETFTFTEEQQLHDAGSREEDLECQSPDREPMLPLIIATGNSSLDLELHWQELLDIMEPENSRAIRTLQGVRSEDLQQYCNNHDNDAIEANQEDLLIETPMQHGLLGPPSLSELEPALFSLTPSEELDDHSTALNTGDTFRNSDVNPLDCPPDYTYLLAEDPSEELCLGINAEDNSSTFNINLLTQDLVDTMGGSPCSQYTSYPENLPSFNFNFHTHDLTPSSFTPSVDGNSITQDHQTSPSNVFLVDEEYIEDEDGLPSPLSDLLEDAAILDEIRLFDLVLEEEFSPEMAARLEEEGYLDHEIAQQETGRNNDHSGSSMVVTEDQSKPRRHQQDVENEADSDSGLSLDFSHSPASPCASEASSYSSSSSSPPSCVFAEKSPFSEEEDQDTEEGLVGSYMELEGTIKQEELEEEEMGAVGGVNPKDVKKPFPPNYGNDKLFNGFPWLEHIGHDHTYNQPWSSASSPYLGKMPTVQTKSSHDNAKPYHHSSSRHVRVTKMWSRDERYAQALKVPFSSELIVNLPVEEFNDLLANFQLNEEQLTLIRDIRRRGKNKIAAQNCRKRKMDVLQGLKNDVSSLKLYRSGLVRGKQEALRNLQEMKRQLDMLYQEVFSRLRDEEGRPLDPMEYLLHFESNGGVTVASRQQRTVLPQTKTSKKQRDKKK